jgi:hypothetical protein
LLRFDKQRLAAILFLWAFMVISSLVYIAVYGHNVPWNEDWKMVPALVGQEPNLFSWLWAQNNEHRLPLQKAIYLILLRASGGNFRIGMFTNILLLAGLCLAMILTARRLRGGQTKLADGFFPLALLHLGHWQNMSWGWQISFVTSTILVGLWLLIIAREPWPLPPRVSVAVGLIVVLLPLSGANGIIFTPFVASWLIAGILAYGHAMTARWVVPFQSACVAVSITLVVVYFIGWAPHGISEYPKAGLGPTVLTGLKFIGMAIGPVGSHKSFCAATFLLLASSIIPLSLGWARSSERFRIFGFLVFAGAMAGLAGAVAWGRAGLVQLIGMQTRYSLLSVPGLCAAYFAWLLYGPETLRDRVAVAFAITSLLALPFNLREVRGDQRYYAEGMDAFERDLSAGLSWQELGDKHSKFLMNWDRDALVQDMRMLNEAKIGTLGSATPR